MNAQLAGSTDRGGGHFRTHRGSEINTVRPVVRLKDERNIRSPASAENKSADRHTLRVTSPCRVDRRALMSRSCKTRVRV